jgi:hypothetical protein
MEYISFNFKRKAIDNVKYMIPFSVTFSWIGKSMMYNLLH